MKLTKYAMLVAIAVVLVLPVLKVGSVAADAGTLLCSYDDGGVTSDNCDLAIDKQVSVNDGPSTEAPTAAQAVSAKVGDTLTWTITVSDNSLEGYYPDGTATVTDTLPSNVTYVSDSESAGEYSNGTWTFGIGDELPATLTLVTTVNNTGLFENTAALSGYEAPCYFTENCIDPAYNDANNANNTAQAYVNVPAPTPVVTTTAAPITPVKTTVVSAPNTGFNTASKNSWTGVIAGTLTATALGGAGYKLRRSLR